MAAGPSASTPDLALSAQEKTRRRKSLPTTDPADEHEGALSAVDIHEPVGPDEGPSDRGLFRRFLSIRPAHYSATTGDENPRSQVTAKVGESNLPHFV
jgi:hypothetical protein